tara:strand:- start:12654 stop:13307 length:654 start_codon:yes stop_codon:yes gene_type:complete
MDKMPIVEDYEEEIVEEQQPVEENVDEETGEDNPNFVYDEQERLNAELVIEEPKARLSKKEIFDIPDDIPETPKPKKERKKRPPMSDAHKEKLKQAREKALETRRKNAREKKEMKELEKQAKQKKKADLQKYVNDGADGEKGTGKFTPPPQPTVDVEKAVLDGIMKYEALRKQRKSKKKEEQAVQQEEDKVKQQLNNALQQNTPVYYGQQGYFDNCF